MTATTHALIVLGGAFAFDLAVGEPPNVLHPVVWMGTFSRRLRQWAPHDRAAAFLWGCMMALAGPLLFGGGAFVLLRALHPWPIAQTLVEIYLLKSAFALRALGAAGMAVQRALAADDLPGARRALSSLVSRDPSALSPSLVAAAAVESVAENSSDSVVAPLIYFLVAGVPGALAYRACNTLDAMIGYHGETEWLGKAAARLDDVANLIPARVTAALVVLAGAIAGASGSGALRTWLSDGARTESPNAGRPMAAMAGALGVQLEKVGHYRLGDGAAPDAATVARAVSILFVTGALAAVAAAAVVCVTHA